MRRATVRIPRVNQDGGDWEHPMLFNTIEFCPASTCFIDGFDGSVEAVSGGGGNSANGVGGDNSGGGGGGSSTSADAMGLGQMATTGSPETTAQDFGALSAIASAGLAGSLGGGGNAAAAPAIAAIAQHYGADPVVAAVVPQ
jgi:hypothetical protein